MRSRSRSTLPLSALLLSLLLGAPVAGQDTPSRSGATDAARANNAFAIDLHAAFSTRKGSFFFSPLSISEAIAMVREGARGRTRREIDRVFHWHDGIGPSAHRALVEALSPGWVRGRFEEEPDRVRAFALHVANALWAERGLALEPPFCHAMRTGFGARIHRLDFSDTERARRAINRWIEKQTEGQIRGLVPEGMPRPSTRLALANAIWFKAAWHSPFEKRWTKPGRFTEENGRVVDAPFMHRIGSYRYFEDERAQVIEIPYRGGETSMLVVLPRHDSSVRAFDAAQLERWVSGLGNARVDVRLPRFSIDSTFDLGDTLSAMGMPSAFDGSTADFAGITAEERLQIDAVLHKAVLDVDEAGTEAAAATVVLMTKGAVQREATRFTADRPFEVLVRHQATGTILFVGHCASPGS